MRLVDGQRAESAEALAAILHRHKPGDRIQIVYADRTGVAKTASVTLAEDPHQEIVPIEAAGAAATPEQRSFRDRWLGGQ